MSLLFELDKFRELVEDKEEWSDAMIGRVEESYVLFVDGYIWVIVPDVNTNLIPYRNKNSNGESTTYYEIYRAFPCEKLELCYGIEVPILSRKDLPSEVLTKLNKLEGV